jgi:hypothetical protein
MNKSTNYARNLEITIEILSNMRITNFLNEWNVIFPYDIIAKNIKFIGENLYKYNIPEENINIKIKNIFNMWNDLNIMERGTIYKKLGFGNLDLVISKKKKDDNNDIELFYIICEFI